MAAAPGVTMMEESETGVPETEPDPLPALEFPPPLQAFRSRSDTRMQINAESTRRVFTFFSTLVVVLVFSLEFVGG
jgi:hypothetical protein